MKKTMLCLFLICIASGISVAELSHEKKFFDANKYYDAGEYGEALFLYQELVQDEVRNGNIYYNIGNAYYKLDKIGYAIANYERAMKYMPHDEDLFANLSFLKSLMRDSQPQEVRSWYEKIYESLRELFYSSTWMMLTIFLYLLLISICALYIFYREKKILILSYCLLFLTFLCAGLTWDSVYQEKHTKFGIVVSPEVEVRYSPTYDGAIAFELHEGIKAQIIRELGDWYHIRLIKGRSGWVDKASLEMI